MKNYYILIFFLYIANCTLKKLVNHHGVHYLEKKQEKLFLMKQIKMI